LTPLNCTLAAPVFVTLNQGSAWSALAPVALVRYWTLSPSAAALAVVGSAVSAAAPMAAATAVTAAVRSRFFANLILVPLQNGGGFPEFPAAVGEGTQPRTGEVLDAGVVTNASGTGRVGAALDCAGPDHLTSEAHWTDNLLMWG
jgi:hypothetical protein